MTTHPSTVIDEEITKILRHRAPEGEIIQQLHADQLSIIWNQNWFNMYLPKKIGGLEMSLPEILKTEEALAWADGSTAWVVTLCSGAAWFVGFLDPGLSTDILAEKNVCFAGSGATTGIAEKTSAGYTINGFWKHASGSMHATVFTANCVIHKDGKPLKDENGIPITRSFVMKHNEVTILKTWNAIGMMATGSNSFEVKNLVIPDTRSFLIETKRTTLPNPVFQYPFLQLAETTLAVNLSGMAIRFLDLCTDLLEKRFRHNPISAKKDKSIGNTARQSHQMIRDEFYEAIDASWDECLSGRLSSPTFNKVTKTSHALAQQSRKMVDELYPYCGLTAADPREEINRVWRNLHTASQHSLFRR